MPDAKAAALRAIELDPTLAEAYTSLGSIRGLHEWHWPEAERYYQRSIELNPNYPTAHHWYACDYLILLRRLEEAMAEMEIALRLDPLAIAINESIAHVLMVSRRYEEAAAKQREIQELDPFYYKGYAGMGRISIQQGRYGRAVELLSKARELAGDVPIVLGALGQAYGLDGRQSEARQVLARLETIAKERYVPSSSLALVHCGLGEKDRALDWLETGCERHELTIAAIGVHPGYDQLRGESRFTALLERIGIV
jgi:tetratricopeptide (TPR) repeat protein